MVTIEFGTLHTFLKETTNSFRQFEDYVITNTFFKLPKRMMNTWKSPKDGKDGIISNQIDYIIMRNRYKNAVEIPFC